MVEPGFRLREAARRLRHGLLHHAPEEKPRRRRNHARQGGPGVRRFDRHAHHPEGPPLDLQPRPSGRFLNATELADYLVTKGIPFREAHHITGSAVALAEGKNLSLEALPLDALQSLCDRIGPDVFDVLEYRAAVARRNAPGGTGPLSVARQLEKMKAWLHETK